MIDRRGVLGGMAVAAALGAVPRMAGAAPAAAITQAEREARIERLRGLMRAARIDALLVEPGSSLIYFTGIEWHRSERLTAAVIPVRGPIGVVTPFFEEPSVRETLAVPATVRTWQEDENPLALVAGLLREAGATGTVAIEETVREFIVDGLARALPSARIVSGAGVVRGCRMIKTPAEIALLQRATDATIAAYAATAARIREGMAPGEIAAMMKAEHERQGANHEFALVLLGEASAYPHGSRQPQRVREGQIVLMDCGCTVEGYQSDVSRTFVWGKPDDFQRKVYGQAREGQRIAYAAARAGAPAGSVDDAVRRRYESWGYGPGYRLPGLSHRTGHGIGLDGHEPVNLVHGETTRLMPGMCFSNEPGIYLPGKFGVRIEDCFTVTENGPRPFSVGPDELVSLG